ncbi:uncharacterized protein LOC115817110 [Chanos chanos]|uniref:Uncharacterized protein LOC115817110 n=1 Tax=Chanos chanos TaxID=29144 RepID=A0A6J2VSZ8_CHACN|nr:uncharacterized protein LOC115817110 [Chanos chanos]
MDFILKNKTILAEILSAATSFILQHVQQKKLISDHDYYELKGLSENPNKMTAELLDKLRARGQDTREKFTDLLKEEFIWEQYPRLRELFPPEPTDSVPAQEDQTDSDCLLPEKKRKTSGTNSDLTLSGLTWAKLEQYISQPGNGEKLIENLEKKLLADTMSKLEADLKSKTPKGNLSLNFEAIYKLETNRELTSFLKPGNGRKFPKIVIGTFFNLRKDREQEKLISDRNYNELKSLSEHPNKMTAELLDKLRAKGEDTREKFTDLLKEEHKKIKQTVIVCCQAAPAEGGPKNWDV